MQSSGSCQAVVRQSPVLNKVIIEKSWYEIFTEQELRFGLELDQLALLKKKLDRLWATFEAFFACFYGKKWKHCSVHTKKLHNIFFFFLKKLEKKLINFL